LWTMNSSRSLISAPHAPQICLSIMSISISWNMNHSLIEGLGGNGV
jgi:hypothetical protein